MCGITGAFNTEQAFSIVKQAIERMQERGRDGLGYYDGQLYYKRLAEALPSSDKKNILGHVLHAIVNTTPQPLKEEDSVLSANCEIYNWEELNEEHKLNADNDADLLLKLLNKVGLEKTLEVIKGVYAFAYWKGNSITVVRDIVGVKPLWFVYDDYLLFASEKKAIEGHAEHIEELNPRTILIYDLEKKTIEKKERSFFTYTNEENDEQAVKEKVKELLIEATKSRIPKRPFGLLFSGGLDSIIIAKILKDVGKTFTCYTAATSEDAPDLLAAKKAAEALNLDLKYKIISKEETETLLKKVVPLIEDNNVIKVGVALPLFVASQLAKEDGKKVIFAGAGADECFAGYHRYKQDDIKKVNKDCYSDLLKIYEKNCYRDDVITMNNNLELRVPFLDTDVIAHALTIHPTLKIKDEQEKYILRKVAEDLDIPKEFVERKKKAAQYGSGFDKTIKRLAKDQEKSKSAYLTQFYQKKNVKLGALISGGKDGWYAAYTMAKQNYDITCLISIKSKNKSSYMFHTPNIDLVDMQAEAMGVPLIIEETEGEKEKELEDLERAIKRAKEEHKIEGIVTGALYSNYQRERVEKIADRLGLKVFSPLWHINQENEMRALLREGFKIILSSIAADGLNKNWLGRNISEEDVDKLVKLHEKVGFNIAGEGGEFESLVLDCPFFLQQIHIEEAETVMENDYTGYYDIKKAILI